MKGSGTIKAVNSSAKAIHGVAKDVQAKYELSLYHLLIPFVNSFCILDGGKTCMSEPYYLAITRLETDEGSSKVEVPKAVEQVLEEFKDVMPKELPKKLPPMREVDHTIELETGSKPLAKAPYRMLLPELEELHKQLKELVDVGYIRPSKALYGAPVLFQRKKDGSLRMCIDYQALNKLEKCSFAQDEVEFSRYKIKDGGLMMDGVKIKAIQEWESPTKVTELRSFLGLVNYYRRFIMGYSAIASPLTGLLKKNKAWIWDEECQATFESLKKVVMEEPVTRLPDVTMPFELHTDASDFPIRGVLMEDGHPIAFESRKLNETKRKYTVQEKEMTAVVHCLRIWRHYLLVLRFVIKTDNIAMSYFQTQKKLSPKQARWQDFLAEFDSRRIELQGGVFGDYPSLILPPRPNKGRGELRQAILKECHDSKWAGHPGITRTLALVEGTNYWPRMGDNGPWESVSMDFITCLPNSEEGGSIIEVVDRFSKYGTFIAAPPDVTTDDTAKLFFKNVLFKIMGTDLNFSTSFHPQTDEQTERVNALLEIYLRHYVSANQHDWAKLLDVAQFSYNMQQSEATEKSPFELVRGRQPLTPNALAASYERSSLAAYKTMKEWHEQADLARASLDKAAKKMKKWGDEKRRPVEFDVRDQVMVKLLP
ncbi:putative nucleotidyltransferase, ribonuclease H [Tanacetum coccineum]